MDYATSPPQVSKASLLIGRIISTLFCLFLLMDGIMKLFKPDFVAKATVELGYHESVIVPLGIVLTTCTILYIVPLTSTLGAILLTGYLGGAVASHLRAGQGAFPVLFPVIVGAGIWGGLVLRDRRWHRLLPLRR